MTYDSEELDSVVDEFRERLVLERESMAEFCQPERLLTCELCLTPIDYGALCRRCDPDRLGLFEENRDRWSV